MNSIIPNRNLPIFKSQKKQEPKKKLSPTLQRKINKEKSNKKLDDLSNIILKLLVW